MNVPSPSHALLSLAAIAVFIILLPSAGAWSNGGYSADPDNPDYGTHDWIADNALTIQTFDVTFLRVTYHSQFLLGTEAPDNPDYIGDTANHHIYFTSGHELQDDVCAVRASQIFDLAKGYLEAKDYLRAAYDIGVLAHYVADPGVFGHTMGASTDWGAETHHSDYETHTNSLIGSLALPSGTVLGDSNAYSSTLQLAEDITFGKGLIQSNVWMDANYDWTDSAFVSSATASLYESASKVAAVINHLMIETSSSSPRVPDPPTSLSAAIEDYDVVLSWAPPANDGGAEIVGYSIYRGESVDSRTLVAGVPANEFVWTDTSAEQGKSYYYWVAAENSAGTSDLSVEIIAIVPTGHNSLLVPILLSAISLALASGGFFAWRTWKRRT